MLNLISKSYKNILKIIKKGWWWWVGSGEEWKEVKLHLCTDSTINRIAEANNTF